MTQTDIPCVRTTVGNSSNVHVYIPEKAVPPISLARDMMTMFIMYLHARVRGMHAITPNRIPVVKKRGKIEVEGEGN